MLTTIESLRKRCGLDAFDTVQDDLLTAFEGLVRARFEKDMNRVLERAAGALEVCQGDAVSVAPARVPIEVVSAWETKASEALGWVAVTGVDYLIAAGGTLIRLASPVGTREELLRVTYAGGYVLPGGTVGEGQAALPGEIEAAVLLQVAYMFQQRDKLGIITQWDAGSTYRQFAKQDLLPEVAAVVGKYRRYTL